ncbi:MAG: isoprenylcysteine carboxylmethyltransferase family protein [Anaerolineae bacterium]
MVCHWVEKALARHREELAGEHPWGDAGQLGLAILFGVVWTVDTLFLHYTTFLNRYVPSAVRLPLAFVFICASGYLAQRGILIMFGERGKEGKVIEKDVYSLVRHPIYLGEILLYVGFLVFSLSLAAAVVWFAVIAFLHHISRYEERLLLERFGGAYEEYRREVPMWIPRLWEC